MTHRMPPRPGELIGRSASGYVIESLLGDGGMGSVYRAFNPDVGKRAAVKVVSAEVAKEPSIVDRFLVEAKTTSETGSGELVVRVTTWARVYIDGVHRGTAPMRLTLPAGKHRVLLVNDARRETIPVTVSARREAVIDKNW